MKIRVHTSSSLVRVMFRFSGNQRRRRHWVGSGLLKGWFELILVSNHSRVSVPFQSGLGHSVQVRVHAHLWSIVGQHQIHIGFESTSVSSRWFGFGSSQIWSNTMLG
ncbi:hypothetical protein Hdeb2414_s0007g00240031 [Helianthus debilis subsp. tardiflorus]